VKIIVEIKMAQKKLRHFLRPLSVKKGFFYSFNI